MKKFLALTLSFFALGAQAALSPLASWDIALPGLAGVEFNTQTSAAGSVSLGAHAYKNGIYLPNDGLDTFQAQSGIYAPDGLGRANWSFDWAYSISTACRSCAAFLRIDNDPSAVTNFVEADLTALFGAGSMNSWNMTMSFLSGLGFNPYAASSTGFELVIRDASGANVLSTGITVNVPEPGTLALVGLALLGAVSLRRKA